MASPSSATPKNRKCRTTQPFQSTTKVTSRYLFRETLKFSELLHIRQAKSIAIICEDHAGLVRGLAAISIDLIRCRRRRSCDFL